jgi:nicotinamidase-related amidase
MKSGDKVIYTSDVHSDFTGQDATAIEFDLGTKMVNLQFRNGQELWAFWDEIAETPGGATPRESK